jgi:hypothetical protein
VSATPQVIAIQRAVHRLTAAQALSPVALAERAGLVPDPWQADALADPAPRLLLNASRQSGKSTVAALLALQTALSDPGSLTLLLSPTLRQSGELFRRVVTLWRAAGRPIPVSSETALSLTLATGSRIVSLPGKEGTVRGFSDVALLVIDEAARVSGDLYAAVRPMLAVSGGRLLALSTPFGTRGWWFEAWAKGGDAWSRYEVPATECPRIAPTFLAEEERTMGAFWFEQEYLCRFLDAESQAFRAEDIDRAFDEEVESWAL